VEIALRWMAFVVFFQTMGGLLLQIPIAHKVMEYQLYVRGLTEPALLIGFAILFYYLGMDLTGICGAYLVSMAIVFFCSIIPVPRFFPWRMWSKRGVGFERKLFRFSFSMFLIDLIAELNGRLDVVIVGSFIEPETIAVYGVMIQLAGIVRAVSGAFDPIANPFFAEYHARGEISRLDDFFKLVTRWVTLVTVPILLVFAFKGSQIAAFVGSEFSEGYPWLMILLLGAAASALLGLSGYVLVMTGHPDALMGVRVVTLLVSGIATFILAHRFGPMGAAIGAAFTAILSQALSSWWVFRRLKVHAFSIKLCKPLLAGCATALLLTVSGPFDSVAPLWDVLGHALLTFLCFGGFICLLGIEDEERQFGLRVYNRIRRIFV
jgi:O-antigen/teichoic acid export membrane protein